MKYKISKPVSTVRIRRHTKLSVEEVVEIKNKLKKGYSVRDIASEYSVGSTTIQDIRSGRTWSEV